MRKRLILVATTCLLLGACKGGRNDTDAQLLASCFGAIKANDWETYRRLALTPADILEQVSGSRPRSPLKGRQGYVGSVLRPEQIKVHEEAFRRAVRGGKGQIDFARSTFVGQGTLLGTQNPWQRMGASFPYRTYSLRVETGGQAIDTKALRPIFTVVTWEGKQRLIDLAF